MREHVCACVRMCVCMSTRDEPPAAHLWLRFPSRPRLGQLHAACGAPCGGRAHGRGDTRVGGRRGGGAHGWGDTRVGGRAYDAIMHMIHIFLLEDDRQLPVEQEGPAEQAGRSLGGRKDHYFCRM